MASGIGVSAHKPAWSGSGACPASAASGISDFMEAATRSKSSLKICLAKSWSKKSGGRLIGDPDRKCYGCFLPDLAGLARDPSTVNLPRAVIAKIRCRWSFFVNQSRQYTAFIADKPRPGARFISENAYARRTVRRTLARIRKKQGCNNRGRVDRHNNIPRGNKESRNSNYQSDLL